MARAAIPAGQGAVGDLADERLDEGVLASLWGARVHLLDEQLTADKGPQPRLELDLVDNFSAGLYEWTVETADQ